MKPQYRLSRTKDFELVYRDGASWAGKEVVMKALPNRLGRTRFGFAVSQRVGKAVVRNRLKRRLREIVRRLPLAEGWDLIFVARPPAARADYQSLKRTVEDLLRRAGLSRGNDEGIGTGAH